MFSWLFGKSAEEQRNEFESKINKIATSLIKNAEQNTSESNMELASLLDPSKCNDYTLFLGIYNFKIEPMKGAILEGDFINGKANGFGKFTYPEGTAFFEGSLSKSDFHWNSIWYYKGDGWIRKCR